VRIYCKREQPGGLAALSSYQADLAGHGSWPKDRKVIFDIGGNNYRLIAIVSFERESLLIEEVLTHEEYSREDL